MPIDTVARTDIDALLARAHRLADAGGRRMLGITGAPGSGKSTLAEQLVAALDGAAALVPMDGFHLANEELRRLGRHERKGAIDTFDAGGYVALLRRLRAADRPVYAPTFRRDLEEAVAGAIRVEPDVRLVVTEGNYLLVDVGGWAGVRPLLDEVWFAQPDEDVRIDRLVRRHESFGRDHARALDRSHGSDQVNAELIAATAVRADVLVVGQSTSAE